jgi:hypothetical protein
MPMTMKYFRFPVDSDTGAPLSMDSCDAFADASSISRFDIVLSSVLIDHRKEFTKPQQNKYSMLYVKSELIFFLLKKPSELNFAPWLATYCITS